MNVFANPDFLGVFVKVTYLGPTSRTEILRIEREGREWSATLQSYPTDLNPGDHPPLKAEQVLIQGGEISFSLADQHWKGRLLKFNPSKKKEIGIEFGQRGVFLKSP